MSIQTEQKTTQPLDTERLDAFSNELNVLREKTEQKIGAEDARYIRKLISIERLLSLSGRALLVGFLIHPALWLLGVICLGLSKILNNMEIGHNILHGQYDWMNDKNINSRNFEWDIAADAGSWKRYHNHEHHTYTNVIGKDRDFGYGLLRLSDDLPWRPKNVWQVFTYLNLSLLFEWGVAYHELAGNRVFSKKKKSTDTPLPISTQQLKKDFFGKAGKQLFKDYVFFPLICWPAFLPVLIGNFIANLIRNLWTSSIIFCGHFTEEVHTFSQESIKNETQAQWHYRQILGSSNLEGSKLFHILTGHLSCQIEHHLFPDIPARHYPEMAKEVRSICHKYDIPYNSGSLIKQYSTVVARILRYSLPDKAVATA